MSLRNILLTGGTGTFGKEFTRQALDSWDIHSIRIYSRGEFLQWEMKQQFNDPRLRFFIGDVRDKDRLKRASEGVDLIVHAAALKQIDTVEYNPIEAIETNINGTKNVINAALDNGVDKVLLISTDKAVKPINLYGATKMVAEKLMVDANAYSGDNGCKFSCVRYGNVMGSRGSVIDAFKKQIESGTLKITHPDMTRFCITIEDGVRFVMRCIESMEGGEIFIPKIPSIKIMDLAEVMAPLASKEVVGVRIGEKLHELLMASEESGRAREFPDCYIVLPSREDVMVRYTHGELIGIPLDYCSDQEDMLDIVCV